MFARKFNVKSSSIRSNTKKNSIKRRSLSKTKAVPPKPNKLSVIEASELKNLILCYISMSGMNSREYAKKTRISLGLQSSLRAISDNETSCVVISQSIKPKFIINQIIYFARQRNSKVPVYMAENLATISESIFGSKATVVAFPLIFADILSKWILKCNQPKKKPSEKNKIKVSPKKTTPKERNLNKFDLNCVYLRNKIWA